MDNSEARDELNDILIHMEIPERRLGDMGWLSRNLGINNGRHPDFERAIQLVRVIRGAEVRADNIRRSGVRV